jgi:hypothetical protein
LAGCAGDGDADGLFHVDGLGGEVRVGKLERRGSTEGPCGKWWIGRLVRDQGGEGQAMNSWMAWAG